MIGKVITEMVFDAGPEENLQWQEKRYGSNLPNTEHLTSLIFETSASLTSAPLCYTPPRLHPGCGLHSEQLHLGNLNFPSIPSHPYVLLSSIFPTRKEILLFFYLKGVAQAHGISPQFYN